MPRVSLAVPAHNCERYIARALESLLAQTFEDFELVISDNASTDRTPEICQAFAEKDPRVRLFRQKSNIGGPANFDYVFSLCRGEYHKWSTADDFWDPTYVEKCVAVLDREPDVVLCYTKTRLVDAEGRAIEDYDDNLDLQDESPRRRFNELHRLIGLCNAHLGVIRRSAMANTHLIGSELRSDVHFLAELALYGKFRVLPETLFFRRFHQESSSWQRLNGERQRSYYDPEHKTSFGRHTWRKYRMLLSAVWHAPIAYGEKLKLSGDLGRMARWDRNRLMRELAGEVIID